MKKYYAFMYIIYKTPCLFFARDPFTFASQFTDLTQRMTHAYSPYDCIKPGTGMSYTYTYTYLCYVRAYRT